MNAFRQRPAVRRLLLLATLAMLVQWLGVIGSYRPVAKDRFDFSAAICTTGSTIAAAVAAASGDSSGLAHQDGGGHDCRLCCVNFASPLSSPSAEVIAIAEAVALSLASSSDPLPGSFQWAPHGARDPPLFS